MGKNRLEAFSDGVIAILITIMVLELKVPHSADFRALLPLWPTFMSYVLSFIYIGIYWNKLQYASYLYIASPDSLFCFAYLKYLPILNGSHPIEGYK